jgi:Peptidase family M23
VYNKILFVKRILPIIFFIVSNCVVNAQETAVMLTFPQYNSFTQNYFSHLYYVSSGAYANSTHFGKDINGNLNDPIYALASGTVVEKFNTGAHGGMGNGIRIKYPGIGTGGQDLYGLYLHLSSHAAINVGDVVTKGLVIGYMGSSGTTIVHCHFELRYFSTLLSPFSEGGNSCTTQNIYQCGEEVNHPGWAANWENPVTFLINENKVQLVAPVNDAQVNATNINFSWTALPNATAYRIQISTTSTFATTVVNENVGNATAKLFSLLPNTEYFWRVKSNLTPEFTPGDEVRRLLTVPAAPQLIYPTSGASNVPTTVNFDWNDTQGALNYRLQVSEDPNLLLEPFNGPYVLNYPPSGTLTQSTYSWNGAQPNKIYYWRVRVNTAKGTSLYAARSFSTAVTAGGGSTSTTTLNYRFDNLPVQTLPADNGSDMFLPVQNLQPGYHTADFYFQSNTGSRSSITKCDFVKVLGNTTANLMEYWFDSSFSARQSLPFSSSFDIDLNVPANNLATGYHVIYYRFQLQGGLWSSVHASSFLKNTGTTSGTKEMEYWYDAMFANRQTITITDAAAIDLNLSTAELALGEHTVYYRFKTGTEDWSSVAASSFIKSTTAAGPTQMEHWFNNGFDNRISTTVTDLNNVDVNVNTNGLPAGNNILYTRFQKANGLWSSITAATFLKSETGNNGWQYQYWVDSTLGLAKTISITDPLYIDSNIDVSNTDTGWHILNSRFRKNNGLWSSVTADSFYKATPTFQCTITNSPSGEDSIATHFLCKYGIIDNPQDGIFNLNKILRADLAKITYRGLTGTTQPEPVTLANYLPSLFGDLQQPNTILMRLSF